MNNSIHANSPNQDELKKPKVNTKLIIKNKLQITFKVKELFIFNIIDQRLVYYMISNSLAINSITLFSSL